MACHRDLNRLKAENLRLLQEIHVQDIKFDILELETRRLNAQLAKLEEQKKLAGMCAKVAEENIMSEDLEKSKEDKGQHRPITKYCNSAHLL
jgi:hypothetical protein